MEQARHAVHTEPQGLNDQKELCDAICLAAIHDSILGYWRNELGRMFHQEPDSARGEDGILAVGYQFIMRETRKRGGGVRFLPECAARRVGDCSESSCRKGSASAMSIANPPITA